MGCASSSSDTIVTQKEMPKTQFSPNPPIVGAVMRNAHESIRMTLKEMSELLFQSDLASFKFAWIEFNRALKVHMGMEDFNFFDIIRQLSSKFDDEKVADEHLDETPLINRVSMLLESLQNDEKSIEELVEAFADFKKSHLFHLEHEESVSMPLMARLASSQVERAAIFFEKIIKPTIKREGIEEFSWYVGWCVKIMSKHGSTLNRPNVAVRVFAHGLQSGTSPSQWKILSETVRQNCSKEIWDEMVKDYNINGPGMQLEG